MAKQKKEEALKDVNKSEGGTIQTEQEAHLKENEEQPKENKGDAYDVEVEIKKDLEKESELNPAKLVEENISLKIQIEELKNQVNEFKQKWIYTFSEYENYRRRVKNEIESEVRNRISKIIENFIEAVDSIESAMKYISDENTLAGIKLIRDIIEKAMERSGAKKIDLKEGDLFDPAKCEVIDFMECDKEEDDKKIAKIASVGFEFGGRIIRPARVIVWKKKQEQKSDGK